MIEFRPIEDGEEIKEILFSPCLWERISEDGQTQEAFIFVNRPEYIWLGIYDGDLLVGMFFLHPLNSTSLQIHIHMLDEHRVKYAYDSGAMIIYWFVNQCHETINKLVAEIPVIYQDVYHFTQKFGFQNEGINRDSYRKNGKIYSQYRLGLTRKEAKTWLQRQL